MSLLVSSTALQLHTEEEHQVVLVHIEKVHMYISHRVFTYNITQVVYYNYTGVEFLFTYMLIYLLVITCVSIPQLDMLPYDCHEQINALSIGNNLYSLHTMQ